MLAHGFTIDLLLDLIFAELATANAERVVAGTEAGRRTN